MSEDTAKPYRPTSAERKLMERLLDPENRHLTVTEICALAGCARSQYYRAFEKPDFVEFYRTQARALVTRAVAPVVNACIREAVAGSAPHAKIVLGMAGEYSDKSEVKFPDKNGDPQPVGGVVFYLPDNGRDPRE